MIRLRNAILRLGRRLRTSSADEGLTATQSSVLATLVRRGPMRAGDLAEAEAVNPTMLSRVLAHLEDAGLAERAADPDDGRCTRVRATAPGTRTINRVRARRAALLLARLRQMPAEHVDALWAALPALEELAREEDPR